MLFAQSASILCDAVVVARVEVLRKYWMRLKRELLLFQPRNLLYILTTLLILAHRSLFFCVVYIF